MQHRILNASAITGAIAFILMILAVGFVDGGNYIAAIVCTIGFAGLAALSEKENGKKRR